MTLNYDRSSIMTPVFENKPNIILLESRSNMDIMNSIICRVHELSKYSKLIVLAGNENACKTIKSNIFKDDVIVMNEQNASDCIPLIIEEEMTLVASNKNASSISLKSKKITKTEWKIIQSIQNVYSKSLKDIAWDLDKNYETLRKHRQSIFRKLEIHSIKELQEISFINDLNTL